MLIVVLGLLWGCLNESDSVVVASDQPVKQEGPVGNQQGPPPTHPAVAITDQILALIAKGKQAKIEPHLKSSFKGISIQELQAKSLGVKQIAELRLGPESLGERAVMALIKREDEEVYVLGLSLERGEYRLADFLTMPVADYEAAKKLWSK